MTENQPISWWDDIHWRQQPTFTFCVVVSVWSTTLSSLLQEVTVLLLHTNILLCTCVVRRMGWALPVLGCAGRRNVPAAVCVRMSGGPWVTRGGAETAGLEEVGRHGTGGREELTTGGGGGSITDDTRRRGEAEEKKTSVKHPHVSLNAIFNHGLCVQAVFYILLGTHWQQGLVLPWRRRWHPHRYRHEVKHEVCVWVSCDVKFWTRTVEQVCVCLFVKLCVFDCISLRPGPEEHSGIDELCLVFTHSRTHRYLKMWWMEVWGVESQRLEEVENPPLERNACYIKNVVCLCVSVYVFVSPGCP